MPISSTAKSVDDGPRKTRSALSLALDAMLAGEEDGYWTEVVEYTNHVPAAIKYAQRRHPGRRYVWEYEDTGVRVWRTA